MAPRTTPMTAVLFAASAAISGCWTVGFEARDAVVAGEIDAVGADRLTLSDIGSEQVSVTGSPDTTAIRGEAAIRVLSTSDGDPTLDLVNQSGVVTPRLRVDGGDLETVSVERFTFDTPSAMDLNYTAACDRLDVDGLSGAVQVYTTGCRVDLDTTGPIDAEVSEARLDMHIHAEARAAVVDGLLRARVGPEADSPMTLSVEGDTLVLELPRGRGYALTVDLKDSTVEPGGDPVPERLRAPMGDTDAGAEAAAITVSDAPWIVGGGGPSITVEVIDGVLDVRRYDP